LNKITGLGLGIAFMAALLASGCMSVDYIGQRFESIDPADVAVYNDHADVPDKLYYTMGKVTVTAPDGYSTDEIRQRLRKEAAEVGADAIEITTAERQIMAQYNVAENTDPNDLTAQSKSGYSSWEPDGSRNYTNSFGETENRGPKQVTRYQIVVRAYFLRLAAKAKPQDEIKIEASLKAQAAKNAAAKPQLTKITPVAETKADSKAADNNAEKTVEVKAGPSLQPAK